MKIFCFLLICISSALTNAQTILTLQPGADEGKDAKIWSIEPNVNFGDFTEIRAMAWTWFGEPGIERTYLAFDLSKVPQNAEICYAYLSLYANDSASSQTNSSLSGPNICVLRRVITPWEEDLITWLDPPSVTNVNEVTLPESEEEFEDVLNIDVTDLIVDMVADPLHGFGFEIRLAEEEYYRRRVFATSDEPDSTHHPKLEICFTVPVILSTSDDKSPEIKIYPNPAVSQSGIMFQNVAEKNVNVVIYDNLGKRLFTETVLITSPHQSFVIPENWFATLSNGIYHVQVYGSNFNTIKELVVLK